MKRFLLLAASSSLATVFAFAQMPASPMPLGAVVNSDHSITFSLQFPGAKQVSVATDALLQPLPMTQGAGGLWSATTPPLKPQRYGYTFVVDGLRMLDPLNRDVHPNFLDLYSDILVPADPPAPWELIDIPHGDVTRHIFTTKIGVHYPGNQTAYVVYTPPGYDLNRKGGYPVLYLMHGFTDTEEGWTRAGKADLMLDRMIAEGKIVPMIVVMPRGYGDFDIVSHGHNAFGDPEISRRNIQLFVQTVIDEIIPAVERDYNVAKGRANRAVAGLSMGGQESLTAGLTHPELFAWVGSMSAGLPRTTDFDALFPGVNATQPPLSLLWIACGTDDSLITPNRALIAWARQKNLSPVPIETPGGHAFPVWRDNLLALAPLLFRK
jgi:enterochelin esterase family protein